jgi:hypothetical protein
MGGAIAGGRGESAVEWPCPLVWMFTLVVFGRRVRHSFSNFFIILDIDVPKPVVN